jgi:hypothetical protein
MSLIGKNVARLARLERAASCLEGEQDIVKHNVFRIFRWTGSATNGTMADMMGTRREQIFTLNR